MVLSALKQKTESASNGEFMDDKFREEVNETNIKKMQEEAANLEGMYASAARALHKASHERFKESSKKREDLCNELTTLNNGNKTLDSSSRSKSWYEDALAWCHIHNDSSLCQHVERCIFDLFNDASNPNRRRAFPEFDNVDGLNLAIGLRTSESPFFSSLEISKCIQDINLLDSDPSEFEIYENSHCGKCRKDWMQTGPTCKLCKLETKLNKFQEELLEPEINCVLSAIADWLRSKLLEKDITSGTKRTLTEIKERSKKFFDFKAAALKEISLGKAKWRVHFDLLSDIDELNQVSLTWKIHKSSSTSQGSLTLLYRDSVNGQCV